MSLEDVDLGGCLRDRRAERNHADDRDDGPDQPELTDDELEEARGRDDLEELMAEARRAP
jgi:hypothetical protein